MDSKRPDSIRWVVIVISMAMYSGDPVGFIDPGGENLWVGTLGLTIWPFAGICKVYSNFHGLGYKTIFLIGSKKFDKVIKQRKKCPDGHSCTLGLMHLKFVNLSI